jgi:hypothetical protein
VFFAVYGTRLDDQGSSRRGVLLPGMREREGGERSENEDDAHGAGGLGVRGKGGRRGPFVWDPSVEFCSMRMCRAYEKVLFTRR